MTGRVVCENCRGTGQADKVDRGPFAPGNCEPCGTTEWVDPETGRREPTMTRPDSPESVPALLPCPFCAGKAYHPTIQGVTQACLWCDGCELEMFGGPDDIPSAEECWNRRSDRSARTARADVEALRSLSDAATPGEAWIDGDRADVYFRNPPNSNYIPDSVLVARCSTGDHYVRNARFLAECVNYIRSALSHPSPTEPEAEQRIREDRASREAERNRLFDLYERDPEQFTAVVAEDRARLRDGEWS